MSQTPPTRPLNRTYCPLWALERARSATRERSGTVAGAPDTAVHGSTNHGCEPAQGTGGTRSLRRGGVVTHRYGPAGQGPHCGWQRATEDDRSIAVWLWATPRRCTRDLWSNRPLLTTVPSAAGAIAHPHGSPLMSWMAGSVGRREAARIVPRVVSRHRFSVAVRRSPFFAPPGGQHGRM